MPFPCALHDFPRKPDLNPPPPPPKKSTNSCLRPRAFSSPDCIPPSLTLGRIFSSRFHASLLASPPILQPSAESCRSSPTLPGNSCPSHRASQPDAPPCPATCLACSCHRPFECCGRLAWCPAWPFGYPHGPPHASNLPSSGRWPCTLHPTLCTRMPLHTVLRYLGREWSRC